MSPVTLLCIMDGLGWNPDQRSNAVTGAKHPTLTRLWNDFPTTTLVTFGERVGLPEGQMGNSEVGHLNIGAGRVVEQWLLRISRALAGDFLDKSASYGRFIAGLKERNAPSVHLIGLYSDGGVHSHSEHLKLLVTRLLRDYAGSIVLHLITDGRDTAPESAASAVASLIEDQRASSRVRIGSVMGRFYAMDRDKRWERVERAYRVFATDDGVTRITDPVGYLKASYASKTTDEFIEPVSLGDAVIGHSDGVLFWNFREDRMRELSAALCAPAFEGFIRPKPAIGPDRVLCFTEYDHALHLPYLFAPLEIRNHLGELLGSRGISQLRVAETEKYPHVTYFFNGGIEHAYPLEDRKMVPSPRDVRTYDLKPEMSAAGVTDIVVEAIRSRSHRFIVVNLANCDMVGHTGNLEAATKAVETVDACVARMLDALEAVNGHGIFTADHGNAEQMLDYETGFPHTAHTTYPVPCSIVGAGPVTLRDGAALCDIAPTVLQLMDIPVPAEMTGVSLIR